MATVLIEREWLILMMASTMARFMPSCSSRLQDELPADLGSLDGELSQVLDRRPARADVFHRDMHAEFFEGAQVGCCDAVGHGSFGHLDAETIRIKPGFFQRSSDGRRPCC